MASNAYLDRLVAFDQLINKDGTPTLRFMAIWQSLCEKSEAVDALQQEQIDAILAAQTAADNANAAADAAQSAATDLTSAQELSNSSLNPPVVLSAASTGVITITGHNRVYGGSGGTVAITGGTVSGFASGDYVNVYYSDATRAGGTVTFLGTTGTIAQEGAIHTIGGVQIPVTGSENGYGYYPPGYIPPYYSY